MAKYIDLEKYHMWLENTLCDDNCDSVSEGYCYTHECSDCYTDNFGGEEDVAPIVYAKWIFYDGTNNGTCSNCGYRMGVGLLVRYCPHCGARTDLKR